MNMNTVLECRKDNASKHSLTCIYLYIYYHIFLQYSLIIIMS